MKYSEKMQLLMKGVKIDEIKALEEQEAKEAAEAAAKKAEDDAAKKTEEDNEMKTALELAQSMIKDLEGKLEAKEDELTKLNKQFTDINNKQTVQDEPVHQPDATDVFNELFNPIKKED